MAALAVNGLNLLGGTCLLINAIVRDEVVWLVLEIYFVAVAIKGLTQRRPTTDDQPNGDVTMVTELAASGSGDRTDFS